MSKSENAFYSDPDFDNIGLPLTNSERAAGSSHSDDILRPSKRKLSSSQNSVRFDYRSTLRKRRKITYNEAKYASMVYSTQGSHFPRQEEERRKTLQRRSTRYNLRNSIPDEYEYDYYHDDSESFREILRQSSLTDQPQPLMEQDNNLGSNSQALADIRESDLEEPINRQGFQPARVKKIITEDEDYENEKPPMDSKGDYGQQSQNDKTSSFRQKLKENSRSHFDTYGNISKPAGFYKKKRVNNRRRANYDQPEFAEEQHRSPYQFRRRQNLPNYNDFSMATEPIQNTIESMGFSFTTNPPPEKNEKLNRRGRREKRENASSTSDMEAGENRRSRPQQDFLPINVNEIEYGRGPAGVHKKTSLADTDPLGVSNNVTFDKVGGLDEYVSKLKEMVMLPLLYPELFLAKKIQPPRGVIFHGPPGTGKTLLARALANSCSSNQQKIAFFMRKGADCLSKWIGEAERQLKLLFEAAKTWQPSIIFFDEIDGLAPVRSSRQDQVHSSIVSTLLALMDGLDSRGQVIVIAATNRIDAVDPALRRPGRFDREFYFPLPNETARLRILDIHTDGWSPAVSDEFKKLLAVNSSGYGGADLKALCTEAAFNAIRRCYPQIYQNMHKLAIIPESVKVEEHDFIKAMNDIVPSSKRVIHGSTAKALSACFRPLLSSTLNEAVKILDIIFPEIIWKKQAYSDNLLLNSLDILKQSVFRPRLLLKGNMDFGQTKVCAAILHRLEECHVSVLDSSLLLVDSSKTMEANCVQIILEARRHQPSVVYIPHLENIIGSESGVSQMSFSLITSLLNELDDNDSVLLLASFQGQISEDVEAWFKAYSTETVLELSRPSVKQRKEFYGQITNFAVKEPIVLQPLSNEPPEELPRAPTPPPRFINPEKQRAKEKYERFVMSKLRYALGSILKDHKKQQRALWQVELQGYDVDTKCRDNLGPPLDLEAIYAKTFRPHRQHGYLNHQEFLEDLEKFQKNLLTLCETNYFVDDIARKSTIVEQARRLMDSILCDMDQFSDEIWDDAMNLSEQLEEELEKARNKVEQVNVIETPSIIGVTSRVIERKQMEVEVDEKELGLLLNTIMAKTITYDISEHASVYARLCMLLMKHRNEVNKKPLIKEMSEMIESLQQD